MNAPLVSATANPPKSDDKYAQLTIGAFIMNDFLQNPHFKWNKINKQAGKRWKIVNWTGSIKESGWEYFEKILSEQDRFSVFRVVKNLQNS